jgi:hypothetical protein
LQAKAAPAPGEMIFSFVLPHPAQP